MRRVALLAFCPLAAVLGACSAAGPVTTEPVRTPVDARRELEDQHERGLITDQEYQDRRQQLIQRSYPGTWI